MGESPVLIPSSSGQGVTVRHVSDVLKELKEVLIPSSSGQGVTVRRGESGTARLGGS